MNILLTAIGSMSAKCAINQLKTAGHNIIGCDIYPKEWHTESTLCDYFYQAPYATDEEKYCAFLIDLCNKHDVKYIVPLTDLEIDVLDRHRNLFDNIICTQSADIISTVRNKYNLFKFFENDKNVPTVKTWKLLDYKIRYNNIVLKPIYGRSSINLRINPNFEELMAIADKQNYIVQEYKSGNIYTVDYCRSAKYGTEVIVAREELLRTSNGAGLTVKIFEDKKLNNLVSYIGNKLNINGTVNMEFIKNDEYYLIDFNPRFSAGIDFSLRCGYDMANNHIKCFTGQPIDKQITIKEQILIKQYSV